MSDFARIISWLERLQLALASALQRAASVASYSDWQCFG
jgi:hypothetical protein